MSPWAWVFDPHSGGTEIPPKKQEEIRQRILQSASKMFFQNLVRLEIRFKGVFCYVDAYERDSEIPIHLVRLRHVGDLKFSLAFYTYSNESYQRCLFPSGAETGTPEEAFEVGASYLS